MKKTYFAILAMLCLGLFSLQAADWYPTNVVKVEPDAGGIPPSGSNGSLRAAFDVNKSAVYELKRGAVYYVNGTLAFGNNNAIIRAEAGEGPRPIIVPFTATGTSNDVISSGANLRLENLFIYGTEYGTNGVTRRGIIRFSGGTEFEFENCVFDGGTSAALLRFNDVNKGGTSPFSININNVVFRNAIDYNKLTNARAIDLRDSNGISLIIKNSTFYSVSAQMIRQGTNQIDKYEFENNTVYGFASAWEIGTAENASFKNNIFYNPVLNGVTTPPGSILTFSALDNPDIPREIVIKNNLFFRAQELDVLLTKNTARTFPENILNSVGYELTTTDPAMVVISDTLSYAVEFKNAPASLLPFYTWHWESDYNPDVAPVVAAENQTLDRRETDGLVGDVMPAAVQPYSFSYPNTSPAAIAGEGGTYLGAWVPYDATSVQKVNVDEVIHYFFDSSAKNLNITFKSQTALAKVTVYTAAGVLISNSLIGTDGQNASVSLPNLSRGAYLFTVEMDGKAASGKFIY